MSLEGFERRLDKMEIDLSWVKKAQIGILVLVATKFGIDITPQLVSLIGGLF